MAGGESLERGKPRRIDVAERSSRCNQRDAASEANCRFTCREVLRLGESDA